jgi:hypothetical protein
MAVLASMAGYVDYGQISSFVAENKEWLKDIVRFPSGGKTPDQGAFRHAFEKAVIDMHEKMAEIIVPSIDAAVNPLRDPGCGNGIPPADSRESAGSDRNECADGCRRAMGSENLSGSSTGILIKTSETGGKSSESNALAEMLGSGGFKGCATTMEACAASGCIGFPRRKTTTRRLSRR